MFRKAASAWIAGSLLFSATAVVVVWQNSQLGVLWDLSFELENAYRIAQGQVPYRDFPFVYPPLTYVVQAALIKLTGAVYWHHVAYAAVVSGLATLLTWQISFKLLRGSIERPRLIAFLLSAPLIVLGIYCIYPHPNYDGDCTFTILVSILLLLYAEEKGFPYSLSFLTGTALVVPMFVKQNTGIPFLGSAALAMLALLVIDRRRAGVVRGYGVILCGMVAGLALAATLIHLTAGLGNYAHWTLQYAGAARMPPMLELAASVYDYRLLPWWLATTIAGALLLRFWRTNRSIQMVAVLFSVPFVWAAACLLFRGDASAREYFGASRGTADCLLTLWPLLLMVSFVISVAAARHRTGMALILPFIVIVTVHGAFLSQGVWASSDGLWPLLLILIASVLTALANWTPDYGRTTVPIISAAAALSLLISGGHYAWSHVRLAYASVSEGRPERSALPALRGLTVRGPWLSQFDELAAFAKANIPVGDGLVMVPGEDLFYYATDREPRFPVLFFDYTLNPDSPQEIAQLVHAHDIRWVVVKRELQVHVEMYPVENTRRLLDLLEPDCKKVKELDNYDIYRCIPALE